MTTAELIQLQYRLKQSLVNDDIESVLMELDAVLLPGIRAFNDLIQLRGRYQNARREYYVKGILKYKDEFANTANHIREGLLLVIDALKPEELRAPEDFDPLVQELNQMTIDRDRALLPVSLVNCDRTDAGKNYRGAKRRKITNPLHFFLLQACPLQMPHSFAERLIWEEFQKLDSDPDAQPYFKQNGPDSILIPALPLVDGDAEASIDEFRIEFGRIHGAFFQKKYTHAAFGFALHEKSWDDSLPEYLESLLAWLNEVAGQGRRLFAFFLVVYIENRHLPDRQHGRQVQIQHNLLDFMQRNNTLVTDISIQLPEDQTLEPPVPSLLPSTLPPVPKDEIEKWLHKIAIYGQAPNAGQILTLFDQFVEKTAPARYRKEGPYDMFDVQKLQKMVRLAALRQSHN